MMKKNIFFQILAPTVTHLTDMAGNELIRLQYATIHILISPTDVKFIVWVVHKTENICEEKFDNRLFVNPMPML